MTNSAMENFPESLFSGMKTCTYHSNLLFTTQPTKAQGKQQFITYGNK